MFIPHLMCHSYVIPIAVSVTVCSSDFVDVLIQDIKREIQYATDIGLR